MLSWISTIWTGAKTILGGNSLVLYLGLALAASILLGWLFWSRASLKADLAVSQANVAALQTAYDASAAALLDLQAAKELQDAALAQREQTIHEISSQRDQWRKKWQEAQHDQAVRDWGAVRLPDAVRELLR